MEKNDYEAYVNLELHNNEHGKFTLPIHLTIKDQTFLCNLYYFLAFNNAQLYKFFEEDFNGIEIVPEKRMKLTNFYTTDIVDKDPGDVYTDNQDFSKIKIVTKVEEDVYNTHNYIGTVIPQYLENFIQYVDRGRTIVQRTWLEFFQHEPIMPILPKLLKTDSNNSTKKSPDNNEILKYILDFDIPLS